MDDHSETSELSTSQILHSLSEGVMITDMEGVIKAVNPPFSAITGYSSQEVVGKTPKILKSGRHDQSFYKKLWLSIKTKGSWQGRIWNRKKNGEIYPEWLTITSIRSREGKITHYLSILSNLTEKKKAEEAIHQMVYFDPLTNLPNRTLFRDRLRQAIHQAKRIRHLVGVLVLDLDRVNIINDTLGHDVGDELLKAVSLRLRTHLREEDTIARLGGDEFMILLIGAKQFESIQKITQKLLDCFRQPFCLSKRDIYITASIGISVFPDDGRDPITLVQNAGTALAQAKKNGRNNFQVFTPGMKTEVLEQMALGNGLQRALDKGEFEVYYQPQLNIENGEIIGMEALVRWNHPEWGVVPPARFIRWAEESGLIIPLGEWVLRQACLDTKRWHEEGHAHLKLAVNLSARQFRQKRLVDKITEILSDTGVPPGHLELELTESIVMDNTPSSLTVPHQLKALGIHISIDDFGTGYSSLNYLKRFPVNTLKIDQSFVCDVNTFDHDAAIAKAVIDLGHGLNMTVLAEGVETDNQLNFLKAHKCDQMQGFLFSQPVPSKSFGKILKENYRLNSDSLFSQH